MKNALKNYFENGNFAVTVMALGSVLFAYLLGSLCYNWGANEIQAEYDDYRAAASDYIRLLESDLGADFIDDVESETDAYLNYYINFPMSWNIGGVSKSN